MEGGREKWGVGTRGGGTGRKDETKEGERGCVWSNL